MQSKVLIVVGLLAGIACHVSALPSRTPRAAGSDRAERAAHHYVFFGREREKLRDSTSFLETPALEGAQVAYTWRELEPRKGAYDFSAIREDLAFLTARRKKLFVQFQDVSFSPTRINVPEYLLREKQYHGGADREYADEGGAQAHPVVVGWTARRWDPAVQQRLRKLLDALGKAFDGQIEGINFAETAVDVVESGPLRPPGF